MPGGENSLPEARGRRGPVSRILSPTTEVIGRRSFIWACGCPTRSLRRYPGDSDGPPCSQFRLAPDGVCRAPRLSRAAGELLPHLFTVTDRTSRPAVSFSVALSPSRLEPPLAAVSALWCPDFPTEGDVVTLDRPSDPLRRSAAWQRERALQAAPSRDAPGRGGYPTDASSPSMRQKRMRWQLGQAWSVWPVRISLAIWGGTAMLQPVHMSRVISTTARPARRAKTVS